MKYKRISSLLLSTVIICLVIHESSAAQSKDTLLVRYYDYKNMKANRYCHELLNMALKETQQEYGPYKMVGVYPNLSQRVVLKRLESGDGVDLVCATISRARKWVLKAIKIPLTKGYIGYRLIMVNQNDKNLFADVTNADQLNRFRLGQEYDWPDTQILRENGVHVVTSQTYDSLFTMLNHHIIDGFPRGIYEITYEIKTHPKMNLAIANGIYLKYPLDSFFYVKKSNLKLAQRIKEGLLAGQRDGSFDRLFKEKMQPAIDAAHLDKRHAIKLANSTYSAVLGGGRDQ